MKALKWIGTAAWLWAAGQAHAQDAAPARVAGELTLAAAQEEALEHSPLYRRAQDREREAGWEQWEAFSRGFMPHVRVSGRHIFSVNYASEGVNFTGPSYSPFLENFPNTSLSLDADFDLFDGFQNIHRLDAANHNHEAAKILSDWSLLQMQENVQLKFYGAIASRLLSDMADQNVKTLEDHLRIVQDQLSNGQATRYDVLRVEVQLSEAKSDQISAHDNVVLGREALAQAMGLRDDDRPLKGELPALDSEALLKTATQVDILDSPQLRAKHLQALAAADRSAASSAALWVPRISLIGQYQAYDSQDYNIQTNGVINTGVYQNSYFFGASATWDILDGGESIAKANEADEQAKEARDDYASAQLQTPYEFDLWKRRLVSSVSLYRAKLTDVDKAKESARLATLGFKAGTRTTTDVLDAELEEYRASAGLVQAQLNALEALINLELVTGKRLTHD